MITFNQSDDNIPAIRMESKLFNLFTRIKYHVYGTVTEGCPLIFLEYNPHLVDTKFKKRIQGLNYFFKLNKINFLVNESNEKQILIGLRKDLRDFVNRENKPIFAASILSTIIYTLEDRVNIEEMKNYKLLNVPKFSKPVNKIKKKSKKNTEEFSVFALHENIVVPNTTISTTIENE